MKFDFKVTTWERLTVPQEDEQRVLEGIKDGSITSGDDIYGLNIDAECETLFETGEQMSVKENGGCATIEVLEDTETIYTNIEKSC